MSLRENVLRSSVVNLVDQGLKFVAIFVITPVMVRELGEYRYGVWLLLMTFFSYYNLLDLGVGISGTRFVAQAIGANDPSERNLVLATCCRFFRRMAIAAIGISLVAFVVAPLFSGDLETRAAIRTVVAVFGISIALRFRLRIYQVILKSFVRFDLIVAASIVRILVQTPLIYWFLVHGHGLATIAMIHAGCEALEYGLFYAFARRTHPEVEVSARNYDREKSAEILKYSLTTFGATTGHFLKNRVDPFLVGGIAGVAIVPIYSIGTRLLTIFNDVVDGLFGSHLLAALSHVESRDGKDVFRERVLESSRISAMITTFLGASIAIYAGAFIERWVGAAFADSYVVLLILIVPYTVFLMQYPGITSLYTLAKHRFIMISTIAGGLFNVALSVVLGLAMGFFGIIWATFIEMTLLYLVLYPFYVCHAAGIPRGRYFAALAGTTLKALIPIAVFYFLLRSYIVPDYLRLFILASAQTIVFGLFAWFLILKKYERTQLLRIVLRKPAAE